ncbi:hypothetical protein J6590_051073 [Homalodisca vitripennis]|nr:hypothetical protein J6590_051073 [Homalodisca vitripennis]
MSNLKSNKVSSYTQVEPEFVDRSPDIRSIIGQENSDEDYLSNRLQEINLREESKGIRPPLVGQASSSSNDSVSLPFERKISDLESSHTEKSSPANQVKTDTFLNPNVEVEQSNLNFIRSTYVSTPYMFTRDDFMSQRPPEGSSDQLGTVIQPSDNFDFPRVRSSSSVSSVASGRPLEWDSGADVGYNQICNIGKNDPGMSTIERIALGCGTNLLARSDPEGTTGPSRQPQTAVYKAISSKNQGRPNNKLGFPNAESTPVGTCVTSSVSPDNISEGVISPIVYDATNKVLKDRDIYPSSASEGEHFENQISPSISHKNSKSKIPLFPEIINSLLLLPTQEAQNQSELVPNNVYQGSVQLRKEDVKIKNANTVIKNNKTELLNFNSKLKQQSSYIPHENNAIFDCENKKLSSSLENIHLIKDTSEGKTHSKTLPRSQSQIAICTDMLVHGNIETANSINIPKYNMALHSLVQYNKSASSSSISTVVHRRDSPKHMFVQTSVLKHESVGVQVSEGKYSTRHSVIETEDIDTPHLHKLNLLDHYPQKSNYFHFDSKNENNNSLPNYIIASKRNKSNEPMVHSHDGVMCKGAHKKVPCLEKLNRKPSEHVNSDFGFMPSNFNVASNTHIDGNRSSVHDTYETNNKKSAFCANTMDSVASSIKSGCWTDKQSSVTVEDRVNSFEYLPGPVYENNERQQIIDSRGTSSVSLHDQLSNNETPDEQSKTWNSSASVSSTLEKDVQRGVEIISDFVKGSCANNTAMKKKLIRRVVEKLISKNYSDDKFKPVELQNNIPWVPSKPPHPIERNGRETRRSVNRSKVPCEFSSRSEKSGSTNLSSECFIPRPAASSTFLPSSLRDNSVKESNSCTTETTPENTPKNRKPPHAVDANVKILENGSVSKEYVDSSSSKQSRNRNYRGLSTKTEKLTEEKQKRSSSNGRSDSGALAQYLSMEREIQLFSIRSEIERLSNLKELLEKQEDLKKGIQILKSRQRSPKKSVLKDRNTNRYVGGKAESRIPEGMRKDPSSKSQDLHKPTLSSWLEDVMADSKSNSTVPSAVSTNDLEGWTSHHYKNENDENIKSCMKRKSNHKVQKSNKGVCPDDKQSKAIYDEPYRGRTEGVKQPRYPSTPYRPRNKTRLDDSIFITDKGITKKNVETETLDTVGVQTSDSIQQLPVVHPNWFRHKHKQSQNCSDRGKTHQQEKQKAPIGYCITFEPSPRPPDKLINEPQPLKEVRIPVPMSEPKQRPPRHLRAGVNRRECESAREVRVESDSGTETATSQSDSDKQPISKGRLRRSIYAAVTWQATS